MPPLHGDKRPTRWAWSTPWCRHEKLDEEVDKWCAEICEKSPTAIAIAKRSFNADSENLRAIGALGFEALALFYGTEESKEGGRAFREKRKPDFRSKKK